MCKGRYSNAYSLEGRQKCESQVVDRRRHRVCNNSTLKTMVPSFIYKIHTYIYILKCSSVEIVPDYHSQSPRFNSQHQVKPGMMMQACNFGTWEVETRESEVHCQPWLYNKRQNGMRLSLKKPG